MRSILLLFFLILLLAVLGCGTGGKEETTADTGEETPPENETAPSKITPPEPRIFEEGGVVYAPKSAFFSVEADDLGCGVKDIEVSVDDGDFRRYKNAITFDEEGIHTIKYRASDNVGNTAPDEVYRVTIDNASPLTDYTIKPRTWAKLKSFYAVPTDCWISLRAADELSGVQRTLYNIDGGDFEKYEDNIKMPGPGAHNITFKSQDNVGIWEREKTIKLVVDGVPPKSSIEPGGPLFEFEGDKWAPPTHKYYLSATDDVIGVNDILYSIDGGRFISYTEPIKLRPGAHEIVYYAVDRAKNKEEPNTFEVNVDSEYPLAKLNVETK
ncbi:MAG: hypothetical protein GY771_00770 [bacterium]|nr:hypothetical protein [bacterium]